jgi:hypothetical protein
MLLLKKFEIIKVNYIKQIVTKIYEKILTD